MSSLKNNIIGPVAPLLGVAIALAIIAILAGMSIMSGSVSSGLTEAIGYIAAFLGIIGLGVAIKVLSDVLG